MKAPWNAKLNQGHLVFAGLMAAAMAVFFLVTPYTPDNVVSLFKETGLAVLRNFRIIREAPPSASQTARQVRAQRRAAALHESARRALPHQPALYYEGSTPADLPMLHRRGPDPWDEIASIPQDAFKATASAAADVRDYARQIAQEGRLTAQEWRDARHGLQDHRPWLLDLISLSGRADFSADAFDLPGEDGQSASGPGRLTDTVSMLIVGSHDAQNRGREFQAAEWMAAAARVTGASPVAYLETQTARADSWDLVIDAWARLVAEQTDPTALEVSLSEMNQMAVRVQNRLSQVDDPVSRDLLARLRDLDDDAVRQRIERLAPDHLLSQYIHAREPSSHQSATAPRAEEISELMDRVESALERRRKAAKWDSPVEAPGPLSEYMHPQRVRELNQQARLDLLRIGTACRLSGIHEPSNPRKDPNDLTPRYIPFPPQDPFAHDVYSRNPDDETLYSLGPDRSDDGGLIAYDPTNGLCSRGDIVLPWRGAMARQNDPSSATARQSAD